jgi:hypothetical protein
MAHPASTRSLTVVAVTYAERGWHVFPLAPRRKAPLTTHGLLDASRDPNLVRAWWADQPHANIGINCGASGLVVVDLDGPHATEAWDRLAQEHGGVPGTLRAATANGIHVYFAGSGRSTAGRIGPGIDTRATGGYVLAPPSVHPSGTRYRWLDEGAPLAPLPGWLGTALSRPPASAPVGERRELPAGLPFTRYGLTVIAGLVDEMSATGEGQRNDTLNALAYRAGRLSGGGQLAEEVAEQKLIAAAVAAGLPQAEATATFRSGFQAGVQYPVRVERRTR